MKISTISVDTLKVYSRLVTDKSVDYQYSISVDGENQIVSRTAKPSKITKSISGENVSSYNSLLKNLSESVSAIRITNTSEYDLLFKVTGNNTLTNLQPIDYIRYSPHNFSSRKNLEIDEKSYTYFSANPRPVEFNLEGPIYLKIISTRSTNQQCNTHGLKFMQTINYRTPLFNK